MSIRVENLKHIYEKGMPTESLALDNISFEVEDGQLFGIIGHTGSGEIHAASASQRPFEAGRGQDPYRRRRHHGAGNFYD